MPVNTMARPALSAAAITSASRIEPPGWITAVAPASAITCSPSGNGKNASDAATEPCVRLAAEPLRLGRLFGLPRRHARGIDAAHLPGADADRGAVLGIDDGVRLDVLRHREGEDQVGQFLLVGFRLVTTLSSRSARPRRRRAPAPGSRRRASGR